MLFMVPFVCLMIFIYSWGYMGIGKPAAAEGGHDEHGGHGGRGWPADVGKVDLLASRFFAYISLFACGMLGLVLADNLVLLFIFWEIMGLCSYSVDRLLVRASTRIPSVSRRSRPASRPSSPPASATQSCLPA